MGAPVNWEPGCWSSTCGGLDSGLQTQVKPGSCGVSHMFRCPEKIAMGRVTLWQQVCVLFTARTAITHQGGEKTGRGAGLLPGGGSLRAEPWSSAVTPVAFLQKGDRTSKMAGMGLIEGQLRDTCAWCGGGQGPSAQGSGRCGSERWGQAAGSRTIAEGTASLCRVASSGQFGVARVRQVAGTMAA